MNQNVAVSILLWVILQSQLCFGKHVVPIGKFPIIFHNIPTDLIPCVPGFLKYSGKLCALLNSKLLIHFQWFLGVIFDKLQSQAEIPLNSTTLYDRFRIQGETSLSASVHRVTDLDIFDTGKTGESFYLSKIRIFWKDMNPKFCRAV